MGRYNEWKPTEEILKKVESLAARGMQEQEIALCLGIDPTTLSKKKAKFDQLSQAIKAGKAKGIARVTQALLKNIDTGNVTAQIFYLKTQAKWREQDAADHLEMNEFIKELKEDLKKCQKPI